MTRPPDLDRLVHLRALREDRAARAVAVAIRQADSARAHCGVANATLDDHDMRQASLDTGFKTGKVVSQRDLGLSRDRVLQADLRRGDLLQAIETATTTILAAEGEVQARRSAWQKARGRREALENLAAQHTRRHAAKSDGEAW